MQKFIYWLASKWLYLYHIVLLPMLAKSSWQSITFYIEGWWAPHKWVWPALGFPQKDIMKRYCWFPQKDIMKYHEFFVFNLFGCLVNSLYHAYAAATTCTCLSLFVETVKDKCWNIYFSLTNMVGSSKFYVLIMLKYDNWIWFSKISDSFSNSLNWSSFLWSSLLIATLSSGSAMILE